MLKDSLANAIIILVCAVWALNFAAQFVSARYQPDPAINGIFIAIVGGVFAAKTMRRGNGNGRHERKD